MFVAVLGSLARCYENQEMFTDAERLSQTQLSLLKERPGENRDKIAAGLPWRSSHSVIKASSVLFVSRSFKQLGCELQ